MRATSAATCSKSTIRPAIDKDLRITRRSFVSIAAASLGFAADKPQVFPTEAVKFADQATDLDVYRLTNPEHQSWLSSPCNVSVARHGNFLVYASDRAGSVQAYRMDLHSGQSRPLTEAKDLRADSLALSPDERTLYYVDGGSFSALSLVNQRPRELYRLPEGSQLGKGFTISADGLYALWTEHRGAKWRVQLITFRTGAVGAPIESADEISDPQPCPKRAALLYRAGDALWQVNFDGAQNRKLRTAQGGMGQALWSSDGRSIFYLNVGTGDSHLNTLREFIPDTNEDRLVAKTSQFVAFNRNGDSSVFVGASGSKASPYVLLLVRSVQRELALCEHRATDARLTSPIFSPNSQRIFFQSDREGKMAIYSMAVDRLVGETESEPPQQPSSN